MQIKEKQQLEVTVDKRHIIAIGERLYTESVDLLRELVNNAFDADATEVHVDIGLEAITIRDDGSGMDGRGLKQYFNIGSGEFSQGRFCRGGDVLAGDVVGQGHAG